MLHISTDMYSKEFNVGEVLTSSFHILVKNPKILIPQLVSSLIFTIAAGLSTISMLATPFDWFTLASAPLLLLFVLIVYVMVSGMYPILVKDVLAGVPPSLTKASKAAFRKIISLLAASILVSIIVGIGLILFIVPGLLFICWFFYTIPALMLEDKGALEAMSTSKSFSRNKKLKTLAVIIILAIFALIGGLFNIIPLIGHIISFLIGLFVAAWASVTPSYIYIKSTSAQS